MILFKGELYHTRDQDFILNQLEAEINKTRLTKTLNLEKVIAALDKLGQLLVKGEFDDVISQLVDIDCIDKYIDIILMALKRENLEYKVRIELGEHYFEIQKTDPPFNQEKILIRPMPLGTLLHIAAGNIDGLPVFSVSEGLITGNVNILKLPQSDKGLSVKIIKKLIEIEPDISDFVYIFDTPSSELHAIKKMAEMADGIVVWGGDAAISALRQFEIGRAHV